MVGCSITVRALFSCMSPPWLHPRSESAPTDTPWCGCHWHQWLWWPPCHSCCSTCSCGMFPESRQGLPAGLAVDVPCQGLPAQTASHQLPFPAGVQRDRGGGEPAAADQVLCIGALHPLFCFPSAFGSGHTMEPGLCSRLLHLSGIWPEACVPTRAGQGGGSPESSDG